MFIIQHGEMSTLHVLGIVHGIFQKYLVVGEELGHGRGLGLKKKDGQNSTCLL